MQENGSKALHREKKQFLGPEGIRKGKAVSLVGTRQSRLLHSLTCWSVKNGLLTNSFWKKLRGKFKNFTNYPVRLLSKILTLEMPFSFKPECKIKTIK